MLPGHDAWLPNQAGDAFASVRQPGLPDVAIAETGD